jgi:putative membrane protein
MENAKKNARQIVFTRGGEFDANAATNPPKSSLVFREELEHFAQTRFYEIMQPGTKKSLRFLQTWAINTLAVALAAVILRGHIHYGQNTDLLLASLLLGILNALIRPILMLVALPLLIFTLGLFTLVINALLLSLVSYFLKPDFQVDGFRYAFLGAIIISVVSIALNVLTGNTRVTIQRRPPPEKKSDDDDGPVIDV